MKETACMNFANWGIVRDDVANPLCTEYELYYSGFAFSPGDILEHLVNIEFDFGGKDEDEVAVEIAKGIDRHALDEKIADAVWAIFIDLVDSEAFAYEGGK